MDRSRPLLDRAHDFGAGGRLRLAGWSTGLQNSSRDESNHERLRHKNRLDRDGDSRRCGHEPEPQSMTLSFFWRCSGQFRSTRCGRRVPRGAGLVAGGLGSTRTASPGQHWWTFRPASPFGHALHASSMRAWSQATAAVVGMGCGAEGAEKVQMGAKGPRPRRTRRSSSLVLLLAWPARRGRSRISPNSVSCTRCARIRGPRSRPWLRCPSDEPQQMLSTDLACGTWPKPKDPGPGRRRTQ